MKILAGQLMVVAAVLSGAGCSPTPSAEPAKGAVQPGATVTGPQLGGPSALPARCMLPIDPGPCEEGQHLFAFDKSKGVCVEFTYGGCEGNANRFESMAECEAGCRGSKTK